MQNQLRPIDLLDAQRRTLVEEITIAQARLQIPLQTRQKHIKELQKQADELAATFKPMVAQAALAYQIGNKVEAHAISLERKRLQAQCEALNAEANALRNEPRELRKRMPAAQQTVASLDQQLARLEPQRHIAISGFEQAFGVSTELVSETLALLPARILRRIREVTYVHSLQSDSVIGRTGKKADNPDKTIISLYPTFVSLDRAVLQNEYSRTIVHEAGHVLFDWVFNSTQRFHWGNLYNQTIRDQGRYITKNARKSLREDFGDCFMLYIKDPQVLLEYDRMRYNFIDKTYKEVQ